MTNYYSPQRKLPRTQRIEGKKLSFRFVPLRSQLLSLKYVLFSEFQVITPVRIGKVLCR